MQSVIHELSFCKNTLTRFEELMPYMARDNDFLVGSYLTKINALYPLSALNRQSALFILHLIIIKDPV